MESCATFNALLLSLTLPLTHFYSHTFTHMPYHSLLIPLCTLPLLLPHVHMHLSAHQTLLFHSVCSPFTIHFTFYLPFPLFIFIRVHVQQIPLYAHTLHITILLSKQAQPDLDWLNKLEPDRHMEG